MPSIASPLLAVRQRPSSNRMRRAMNCASRFRRSCPTVSAIYTLRGIVTAPAFSCSARMAAPRASIMPTESNAQYVEPGMVVFAKGGGLFGQSFNASTGQVSGEPFAIAESVRFFLTTTAADFSTSPNGSLVFQSHADSIAAGVARPLRPRAGDSRLARELSRRAYR